MLKASNDLLVHKNFLFFRVRYIARVKLQTKNFSKSFFFYSEIKIKKSLLNSQGDPVFQQKKIFLNFSTPLNIAALHFNGLCQLTLLHQSADLFLKKITTILRKVRLYT